MIESERLILRPPQASDFEDFAAMFAEAAVMTHIGGHPLDREQAWARFLRDVGHWTIEGFGQFTILEAATGAYVGKVGCARFERDLGDRAGTGIEMSWTLGSRFHGRGYATEAARAAQAWFDGVAPHRTACLIAPANLPSRKLAARLGYEEAETIRRAGEDVLVLVREQVSTAGRAMEQR